jgi:sulfoacetaldehyde dehydrogenase
VPVRPELLSSGRSGKRIPGFTLVIRGDSAEKFQDLIMARTITEEERQYARLLLEKARAAMLAIEDYDQARIDRLCQAVGWATANQKTFTRLAHMSMDESELGDRAGRPNKRFKIMGILRDALRQKSMGVIEELPEKGIVKYAKPAGVIASLVPVTNAALTEAGTGIYALKCKDAIIFSPHPASRKTTLETVRIMRATLNKQGVPEDIFQCIERPSIPLAQELMAICDLTIATGGPAMVRSAYSSGKPAFGVGAGNATMVIDETANIEEAARNTRLSKTSDNGSGCSADGNLLVDASIYDPFLEQLQKEGGYLVAAEEKQKLQAAMWDAEGHRTSNTIARPAAKIAEIAGFSIPEGKSFLIVQEEHIGKEYLFSSEKLSPVLAIFRYSGFENVLAMVKQIYEVGGKGHSCGIYSFDDDHIHRLALTAPVSRMMVRQPQSKANAGAFNNGMPMTSSMGCGIWGGNITNENIALKHYMNVTWVSRPIPEDRPSEAELFGEFLNSETFD